MLKKQCKKWDKKEIALIQILSSIQVAHFLGEAIKNGGFFYDGNNYIIKKEVK